MDIAIRGELWDNDSADVLRWWGFRDITAPMDIAAALDEAGGEAVTVLINSPGGDMTVGNEIRSMLRRYSGHTTALYQGYGASAATLAASGCNEIVSEPGALLCYHNPSTAAEGDYREMHRAGKSVKNARDGILDIYLARPGCRASREELATLMDKDIFITPAQAMELGLIDRVAEMEAEEDDPALVATAGGRRIRLTQAMRQAYREHQAQASAREQTRRQAQTANVLGLIRALSVY